MPAKKGADRKASRPAAQVYGDKMERAYATFLNLNAKVDQLSKHRAIKYDVNGQLATKLNRFIDRMTAELSSHTIKPGAVPSIEEAPKLDEFLD